MQLLQNLWKQDYQSLYVTKDHDLLYRWGKRKFHVYWGLSLFIFIQKVKFPIVINGLTISIVAVQTRNHYSYPIPSEKNPFYNYDDNAHET